MINMGEEMDEELGRMMEESQERRHWLAVFPEELWLHIFDAVENPDDLIACSQASTFFRDLLETRKSAYLFPQALKILADQRYITRYNCADLLKFRSVCKSWRIGVNRLLETPLDLGNLRFENYVHTRTTHIACPAYFRLYNPKIMDKLESEILPKLSSPFYQTHNPFPSRYLEIIEYSPRDAWPDDQGILVYSRQLATRFLEQVGHHFWYAVINAGMYSPPLEWCELIFKYARLLPNLKYLYIQHPGVPPHGTIDMPPFPPLRDLQLLSLEDIPTSMTNAILRVNGDIQALIIPRMGEITEFRTWSTRPSVRTQQRPLEELNFTAVRNPSTLCISITRSQYFNSLPQNWNLVSLWLELGNCSDINLPSIFRKLESYKNSLVELHLRLPRVSGADDKVIMWETSRTPLHLPELKSLELETRNICSLDFLLGLMSLEALGIHCNHMEVFPPGRATLEQVINLNTGHSHNMGIAKCNVWDLIPSLRIVKTKLYDSAAVDTYRRGENGVIITKLQEMNW